MSARRFVRLEVDGGIATLTIDRPEKLNALDRSVVEEIGSAVREAAGQGDLRCMIVTGAGEKAFVAGADISEMKPMGVDDARRFAESGHAALDAIESAPFPVIAAVNGFALGGGCEIALACDFIYASDKAKLGQPEVKLGVIPGFGGTQRLARRVGIAMARELVYGAGTIDAATALRIGLVNAVFPAAELMSQVRAVARNIASMGPLAVRAAKRVLREGEEKPLAEANRLEIAAFASCFTTTDQKEGMSAFLEKRAARFTAT